MKIVSIIILGFVLFLSNTVMAEIKPGTEDFTQAKTKILQAVTTNIEILSKFKSCVEEAKIKPEVGACRKDKKAAIKAFKKKNKRTRAK